MDSIVQLYNSKLAVRSRSGDYYCAMTDCVVCGIRQWIPLWVVVSTSWTARACYSISVDSAFYP